MLTDTGPLVALLDAGDPDYRSCRAALKRIGEEPLLTTWPCFTEAMHFLGRRGGYTFQARLWQWKTDRRLMLHGSDETETDRMRELMATYRDTPMDLADASLVAAAESLALKRIFTLDGDFRFYRLAGGSVLEVVP
jgi:predicted nucleic acid-binding protein